MGNEILEEHINKDYEWGFTTDIESDTFKKASTKRWCGRSAKRRMNLSGCWSSG